MSLSSPFPGWDIALPDSGQSCDFAAESGLNWSACTARGAIHDHNSDAFAAAVGGPWVAFAVADGVGSLPRSPAASYAAVRAVQTFASGLRPGADLDLAEMADLVNGDVHAVVGENAALGATTLVGLLCDPAGGGTLVTVGDSEVLAVDRQGAAGRLNPLDHMPARPNVLLAWIDGSTLIEPHIICVEQLPWRLCLVTDGIVKALSYERIAEIVRTVPANVAARDLVVAAQLARVRDDVTAVVLGWGVAGWESQRT